MDQNRNRSDADLASIVQALLNLLPKRPFAVRLPDGTTLPPEPADACAQFTLVLKQPAALRRMFLPPSELAFGESYIYDDYDIEGNIVTAFETMEQFGRPQLPLSNALKLGIDLLRLERNGRIYHDDYQEDNWKFTSYKGNKRLNSQERDQKTVQFHYDLSTAYHKLMLGENMEYSCAYFASEDESLESAQKRKLDLICRKLDLQPGERFLDIGCGWGSLIIHAVKHYGVKATGITLSNTQLAEAQAQIDASGIGDRCHVECVHFEDFAPTTPFDKISSVEMFEHVDESKTATYFAKVHEFLVSGGLFLLQTQYTHQDRRHAGHSWMEHLGIGRNAFLKKYAFPDSRVVSLPATITAAEQMGFETRDFESMREHFPITMARWLQRLEENHDTAVVEVGEVAYRVWRLILAGYLYLLKKGHLSVFQLLFAKPLPDGRVDLPLIRKNFTL